MCFVPFRQRGIFRSEMPARRKQNIIAVLAQVLGPHRWVRRAYEEIDFRTKVQLLHLLDDGHAIRRRRQGEYRLGSSRFGFQDQIGKVFGARCVFSAGHYLIAMLLSFIFPERCHLFSPVRPLDEKRNFSGAVGGRDRTVEKGKGLLSKIRRLWKGREEIAEALFVDAV